MNSPFQLQIDFTNDCNWIYAFTVKLKIRRHIRLHRRYSKNPNNLHKNSLFSKSYITSNEIVMENYKWCLKGHKRFEIWAFILAIMTSHLLLLELQHAGWDFSGQGWFVRLPFTQPSRGEQSVKITVSTNQSLCYNNFEI